MDQRQFKNWLDNVDKEISQNKISLEGLGLDENICEYLEVFAEKPEQDVNTRESSQKTAKRPQKTIKSCEGAGTKDTKTQQERRDRISSEVINDNPRNNSSAMNNHAITNSSKGKTAIVSSLSNTRSTKFMNKELTFTPLINKKSTLLAQKFGSFNERLLSKQTSKNSSDFGDTYALSTLNDSNSVSSIGKSSTTKSIPMYRKHSYNGSVTSKDSSTSRKDFSTSFQKMIDWEGRKIEKLKKIKEDNIKEELSECTFAPKISSFSKQKTEVTAKSTLPIRSYSKKINEVNPAKEEVEPAVLTDITSEEYAHALDRLHWELGSLNLS